MKTQMRFQKIFMIVALVIAALCVVYAFAFCSGSIFQITNNLYDSRTGLESTRGEVTATGAKALFMASQNVSDVLLTMGIVMILCVVLNYVSATNKRRKYYITNYITIGIVVAYALALAVVIIVLVVNCSSVFNACDFESMKYVYERRYPTGWDPTVTWMFPLGYAVAALHIVMAIGFILNLVWKVKLMQGEKKLLEGGLVKEVA